MPYANRFLTGATDAMNRHNLSTRVAFLIGSAVTLSALIIGVFNSTFSRAQLEQVCSGVELAAWSLIPYMISAAVAAITAICVLSLLPAAKMQQPAPAVKDRLQGLADGDLATKIQTRRVPPHLQEVVYELNMATSNLSHQVAQWKVINRQQWELLEAMREITVVNGQKQLVRIIEQMETNWEKIAQIEDSFKT